MNSEDFQIISTKPMLLGECPLWHPSELALYWIDISDRAVYRYDPSSHLNKCWNLPSEPGCIAWNQSGGLVIAMRSGIATLDTDSGELRELIKAPYDTKVFRFNDGRSDAAGRLWTGTLVDARDSTSGRLYRYSHGHLTEFDHPFMVSNGIAFSPDSRTMYHSDTAAHRINAYDFNLATGSPSNGRVFRTFNSDKSSDYGGRPDGAAVDSEGAYWVAMYEGSQLLRLAPDGELLESFKLPFICPTMVAFGGTDMKTLFITSASQKRSPEELKLLPLSGFVVSTKVSVAGLPEHPFKA